MLSSVYREGAAWALRPGPPMEAFPRAKHLAREGDPVRGFFPVSPSSLRGLDPSPLLPPRGPHAPCPHPLPSSGASCEPSTWQFLSSCLRTSLKNVLGATSARKPPAALFLQSSLSSAPFAAKLR